MCERSLTSLSRTHLQCPCGTQKIDGSPGFTEESLSALKNKVLENRKQGKETFVNLVMDEMSIRKKVEWVVDKFIGHVGIGDNIDRDSLPEAKEVLLVFLVTCINGHWKLPLGYFCIDGLSGGERANLVKQCLQFLHESEVSNISLMVLLLTSTWQNVLEQILMPKIY